jgi:hypothetical protein
MVFQSSFYTAGSVAMVALMSMSGSWRKQLFLASMPSALSLVLNYLYLPESPRHLVTVGKPARAKVCVAQPQHR